LDESPFRRIRQFLEPQFVVQTLRRILVSSSGTHSVRSDRVAPDSLRIFRGLYFTIPRRELATRFTEILLYLR
jgi:hypothetical protein